MLESAHGEGIMSKNVPAMAAVENRSSPAVTVLLVEDDRHIQRSVSYQLTRQGYDVTCCEDGEEALERALQGRFQVIILDIMLPRLDGLSICKRVRAAFPDLPVIITSARGTDLDKIAGLEFGADDYLAKPFSPAELEARIRAVRRRLGYGVDSARRQFAIGDVVLDCDRRQIKIGETTCHLTPKEFEMMSLLMQAPGRVFTRETLLSQIWGYAYDGYNRAVDAHLHRLRTKLMECAPDRPELVEAIYGVGYRFRVPGVTPE